MNRDAVIGVILLLSLFGVILLTRRPAVQSAVQTQLRNPGTIQLIPTAQEPPHYRNKETRFIEYNELNLPVKIEIVRDYTVS
jgi:hypothetical protein